MQLDNCDVANCPVVSEVLPVIEGREVYDSMMLNNFLCKREVNKIAIGNIIIKTLYSISKLSNLLCIGPIITPSAFSKRAVGMME